MQASNSDIRRHFKQFDDELQDSDQTFSQSVQYSRPRHRPSSIKDASNNSVKPLRCRFPTSAFFSDSTDDDVSRPIATSPSRSQLSRSACNRSKYTKHYNVPLHMSVGPREGQIGKTHMPRLHVHPIQFPITRSVLWDRRPLSAGPIKLSLEQILLQFIVSADALKEIYKLYREKKDAQDNYIVLCYLYGNASMGIENKVLLKRVMRHKEDVRAAGIWCVPVLSMAITEDNSELLRNSYVSSVQSVQSSYRDEYTDDVSCKLQPKLLVFQSSPHAAQLEFQLECVASPVLFTFNLVRNLPLLMTPLAATLAKRDLTIRSGNLRSGYLTLDSTRKAVPLLKVDPLVMQYPIIGVWVYGVQIDDAWDDDRARRQLASPFLYFACIGFLMSEAIRERVGPAKNTFLVALYPANDLECVGTIGTLPRFFECSYSSFLSPPEEPLPLELYSHRRSCLVGVSKFSTDVEFILSAATTREWEEARHQMKIPASLRTEIDNLECKRSRLGAYKEQERSVALQDIRLVSVGDEDQVDGLSGWTITDDAIKKSVSLGLNGATPALKSKAENAAFANVNLVDDQENLLIGGQEKYEAKSDSDISKTSSSKNVEVATEAAKRVGSFYNSNKSRSCCKTQQLLTIQHQQILENQQKQLHDMQDQISQLRHLLSVARSGSSSERQTNASLDDGIDESGDNKLSVDAIHTHTSSAGCKPEDGNTCLQLSMASESQRNEDDSDSDINSLFKVENDRDDSMDFSLSSLNLSSIRSGSDAGLSSQSSSPVGRQAKQLCPLEMHDKDLAVEKAAHSDVNRSTRSEPPEVPMSNGETAQQLALSEICGDDEADSCKLQEHENAEERSALKLFLGELDEFGSSSNPSAVDNVENVHANIPNFVVDNRSRGDNESSGDKFSKIERLLSPDAYLRKIGGFVDLHKGCFTTPSLDFHSFCVPRIKYSTESPEYPMSDSEDEETRLIERKYKQLMAA
ncbi:hypothetical protein CCR75_000069 [Bremia lactucae]|uniref:STIL N-terminal domain-containing protein n=1 Tax=Bremia lactucae TaxID=4779 RepID=A0A976FIQ3_BRELC|nr:hypothetical protein CCR75_000069 [Bremia lactucae]